jgi:DNA-binding NarL/FixJ family response regulator
MRGSDRLEISSAGAPRVVVASDVLLYREGLASSLAADGRLAVVATVGASDALEAISRFDPEAALIDASAPEGLPLARAVRGRFPECRLVGFGLSGGAPAIVAGAESGLVAFVDRDGTIGSLVEAVFASLRGEVSFSPKTAALICERLACLSGEPAGESGALTRREREVAQRVADGLSNKEIAIDLRIGPATVKNHVHNILEKLHVRRRAAVADRLHRAPAPTPEHA